MLRDRIFQLIEQERERQSLKFASDPIASDTQFVTIVTEELGEVCRAINQGKRAEMLKEMIQTCAVIIAHMEEDLHFGNAV